MTSAAVRHVQERHARVADDLGGGALLSLPSRELEGVHVRVLAALVAARAADEPALRALVDPARGSRGRPEVGVIRVRRDHHESLRSPGVRLLDGSPGQRLVGHPAARAARSSPSASSTSAACPSALTFGQARATRPSGSMRKVERMTPM